MATTPDPARASPRPSWREAGGDPAAPRARRPGRRWLAWIAVAALALLGLYFYFAYAGSVVPLRVAE